MRISIITAVLCCLFFNSEAQLKPAKLFADHMVLQRDQDVPVWGWCAKGEKVKVEFNGQTVSAKADEQGYWKVILKPMPAGGPYTLKIAAGGKQLIYNDVMMGEVWIASGQSNMELALRGAYGYKFEVKEARQIQVRQFQVPKTTGLEPEKDLSGGQWVLADTNTVGDFSAVGYFFAKELSQQLHVTVGLINSNWGGTQIEDWISRDAMLQSPVLGAAAKDMPTTQDELQQHEDKILKEYAFKGQPVVNYSADQLAAEPASFFSAWQPGSAPGAWEWMGKTYAYRGQGFMQRTVTVDSISAKRSSTLRLGQTDADLNLYINGKLLTNGKMPADYQLNLPPGTWHPGNNSLLIDLKSAQKKPEWFGIGINAAGGDLYVAFPDTIISIADGNWRVMPDLSKPYHFEFLPNNAAFDLYNTMINPLIPYAIAGVIWYQGESNAGRAFEYRTSFPLMITDWRSRWKKDFPFLFVQLASFGGTQGSNTGSNWAELREAQNTALQLPNTGMAVITDVSDANNLHPKDKASVGYRLAYKALNSVYHMPGFYESPVYKSADFSGGYATVDFTHAGNGLLIKDKYGYLRGFELAGADHKFYYAQAVIVDGNKVKVWCPQVPQPVAVRYGWTDAPVDDNLFSKEGLPVSPFRSDDWKGITEANKFK